MDLNLLFPAAMRRIGPVNLGSNFGKWKETVGRFPKSVTLGTVTFGTVTFRIVTFGTVTFGIVTVGTVTFGTVTFETVTFGTVTFGIVTFGTVTFGTVTFGMTFGTVTATFGIVTLGPVTFGTCGSKTMMAPNGVNGRPKHSQPKTPTRALDFPSSLGSGPPKPLLALFLNPPMRCAKKWKDCPPTMVVPYNPGPRDGLVPWATHYFGFYRIWVSRADHAALIKEQRAGMKWTFPTKQLAKDMDKLTWAPGVTQTPVLQDNGITQRSKITRPKMENAVGMRSFVNDQTTVMNVEPGIMYRMLRKEKAVQLENGLWPAEWLHRSAFSFGGLGDTTSDYASSQRRTNLVLGTSESNTYMILYALHQDWEKRILTAGAGSKTRSPIM
ncbi:hypothetical protein MSAN_00604300 [Mycena sanguinolenta]|uniref:Uncharacterized protein n=1 Tax=Mycena sanguinolenta TaxID=230812 RepID=A0A8H6ZAG1_9AGAR|nr:hypothetical protein MSAN_00604300 [Mycena sanguinolenta]